MEFVSSHVITAALAPIFQSPVGKAGMKEAIIMGPNPNWRATPSWFSPKPVGLAPILARNVNLHNRITLDHDYLMLGVDGIDDGEFAIVGQEWGPILLVPFAFHQIPTVVSVNH
jgi:hypothetical protein